MKPACLLLMMQNPGRDCKAEEGDDKAMSEEAHW